MQNPWRQTPAPRHESESQANAVLRAVLREELGVLHAEQRQVMRLVLQSLAKRDEETPRLATRRYNESIRGEAQSYSESTASLMNVASVVREELGVLRSKQQHLATELTKVHTATVE